MSSKFWSRVLEAGVHNVLDFQEEIEAEERKALPYDGKLTMKYLFDQNVINDFCNVWNKIGTISNSNSAMVLTSDEPPIAKFKEELKDDLGIFNKQLMEEYDVMKEFFTTEFKQKLKEKKTHEESDIHNESASVGDVALIRDRFKVETRNNDQDLTQLFKSRLNKFLKQMVFIKWRNEIRHKKLWRHNLQKFEKKRKLRLFRLLFDEWRSQVHFEYKKKQIELKPIYYQHRKAEVIDEWDKLISGLRGYIEQLQMEIKVEVNAKAELIKLYESVMNGSVVQLLLIKLELIFFM